MKQHKPKSRIVELGKASTETRGKPVGRPAEPIGYFALGLSND